jgi:hypothetical protein
VVFVGYGLFAASIRDHVISRPRVLTWMRRTFAAAFVGLGARLALGWSVAIVQHPPKMAPSEVLKTWAKEWAKEEVEIDWQKLLPPRGFRVLPRRWVVERTFSWLMQNRRMSQDYEKLCATGEAFVYTSMTRLMARRLARA